jgi:iron complex transport system ATP-binding protein
MTAPLAVRGLQVVIEGHRLLDGVDLSVDAGGWLCVVGPNGAGKTTLLRALAGLVRPAAGSIEVGGASLDGLPRRRRAALLALMPQEPVLPPATRVRDYVLLGRTPHLSRFAGEQPHDLAVAHRALEQLDALGLAERELGGLSGGERKRVVMARVLAQEAAVLLLDEPTAALDPGHQLEVLELVDQLRHAHGLTVVSTMHELTLAGQFADRLVLLDGGRVVVAGTADEVLRDEHLARHYGTAVRVVEADGVRLVVALRSPRVTKPEQFEQGDAPVSDLSNRSG